jgi:hypothetical protein
MTTLAYATLEPNDDNQDGAAVTLYFVEEPTRQDIEAALNENLDLCLASEDQGFESYTHQPTRDGLVRVQVLPA